MVLRRSTTDWTWPNEEADPIDGEFHGLSLSVDRPVGRIEHSRTSVSHKI